MPQPPHSPHLALANTFFIPKLKTLMKDKHSATIEEIKEKSEQELKAIPKSVFQKCFKEWKKRLRGVILKGTI